MPILYLNFLRALRGYYRHELHRFHAALNSGFFRDQFEQLAIGVRDHRISDACLLGWVEAGGPLCHRIVR